MGRGLNARNVFLMGMHARELKPPDSKIKQRPHRTRENLNV